MAEGGISDYTTEPEAALQLETEKHEEKTRREDKEKVGGKEKEEEEGKKEGKKDEVIFQVTVPSTMECARHGLGKGIDATAVHPWESRSPYEAREVTTDDIVVLYEGMRVHQYTEQIDSYYNIQGSIETSLKIPNKPIEMGVAADASRSSWFSKEVRGKKVLKCTIAFDRRTRLHSSRRKQPSNFELDLRCWLIDNEGGSCDEPSETQEAMQPAPKLPPNPVDQCILRMKERVRRELSEQIKDREPSDKEVNTMLEEELAKLCKKFLLSLGGITHYVSSITLGAMEYSQHKSRTKKTSFSQSSTLGVERVTTLNEKVSGSTSLHKFSRNLEKLGRFELTTTGKTTDDVSDKEAVVHYAFTPLSSLVRQQQLCKAVQQAIQDYSNDQLSTHSGPYLISCTEPMDDNIWYWKIEKEQPRNGEAQQQLSDGDQLTGPALLNRPSTEGETATQRPDSGSRSSGQFVVKLTSDYTKASKFFIELDRSIAGGFFFITSTDAPTKAPKETNRPEIKRYIHMKHPKWIPYFQNTNITLAAYATVVHDSMWTTARFQAVDHQSHRKRALEQSDWLPDKGRIDKSQPCFLTPRYHSACLAVVRKSQFPWQQQRTPNPNPPVFSIKKISRHQEGKCHMLFTLTRPMPSTDKKENSLPVASV